MELLNHLPSGPGRSDFSSHDLGPINNNLLKRSQRFVRGIEDFENFVHADELKHGPDCFIHSG